MTRKILIAYDGSPCADVALADLPRAGLSDDIEALIVSVAEYWTTPPPPSAYEIVEAATRATSPADLERAFAKTSPAMHETERIAQRALARVQLDFPDWRIQVEAVVGSPAREIILRAEKWNADLIVVGSHGHTALGRMILGSISQKVLAEAHCSVRVARSHDDMRHKSSRILVGIDGSYAAEKAIETIASRRWAQDTEVRIVTAILPTGTYGVESHIQHRSAEALHEEAKRNLLSTKMKVTSEIKEGDPKHVLVDEAKNWRADNLFIGAYGHHRLERWLLGSVSYAVAARVPCTVEVVRPLVKV